MKIKSDIFSNVLSFDLVTLPFPKSFDKLKLMWLLHMGCQNKLKENGILL